ncbi:hypothetical protein IFU40_06215 [Microbacterium sp. CFBP 13617]|uniref:hypothetical protein n=1 Tax=Microbacterium sp. CFBP 13617 TaxID=2774035 RepID=UPI001780DD72|nr:hypothetical protein [Microbacterium sp. CFBP 13617]MBD8218227.1 hypothetical protein [Microbacterium sp. CFBP 13617]
MSAGPIAQDRRAHTVAFSSTADNARVCVRVKDTGRGYCGRKTTPAKSTSEWGAVSCSDCEAARRADLAAGPR